MVPRKLSISKKLFGILLIITSPIYFIGWFFWLLFIILVDGVMAFMQLPVIAFKETIIFIKKYFYDYPEDW